MQSIWLFEKQNIKPWFRLYYWHMVVWFYRSFVAHTLLSVWQCGNNSAWLIDIYVCASLEIQMSWCKFREPIVIELILETYFTLKNFAFLLAEGCKDRTFSYLGKADKMLERHGAFTFTFYWCIYPKPLYLVFVWLLFILCTKFLQAVGKIIELLSPRFRNYDTEYKKQVTECASLNRSYGVQRDLLFLWLLVGTYTSYIEINFKMLLVV